MPPMLLISRDNNIGAPDPRSDIVPGTEYNQYLDYLDDGWRYLLFMQGLETRVRFLLTSIHKINEMKLFEYHSIFYYFIIIMHLPEETKKKNFFFFPREKHQKHKYKIHKRWSRIISNLNMNIYLFELICNIRKILIERPTPTMNSRSVTGRYDNHLGTFRKDAKTEYRSLRRNAG